MNTSPSSELITISLAETLEEKQAAQRLRFNVFYEENGAKPSAEIAKARRDFDRFDEVADHLIVKDNRIADPADRIIGTYRLLRREKAEKIGSFYTSSEYDIFPLLDSGLTLLELGRSCVLRDYRTRPVLQLLWQGITNYMLDHDIDLMFGCASFPGTEIAPISRALAYLHHNHLARPYLRTRALDPCYIDMNLHSKETLSPREIFTQLPPLIKGYLRLGAEIGDGAVIDHQFNTVDVCIILPMAEVSSRYRRFYGRKLNREVPEKPQQADDKILA